jgi:hypothetical protein
MDNTTQTMQQPEYFISAISQDNLSNQLAAYAADLLVNKDKNSYEVKQALIAKGLNEENATVLVENLEQQIEEARKKRANKDMLVGGLWLGGGLLVTVFTYASASNGGGSYVVTWGALLFGGIQFVKGLMASMK